MRRSQFIFITNTKETMDKRTSSIIPCLALSISLFAQSAPSTIVDGKTNIAIQDSAETTKIEQIKGVVMDEQQKPIPFANIVMSSSATNTYIAGCVTAEDGSFVLPYSEKDAILKVSYVGYTTQTLACKPNMSIVLQSDVQLLNTVTIKSTRPKAKFKDGAFTTLVSGTILAELGTANDMISQLPFVSGDDGNWEIIGRGKPEIYLNGRKVEDTNELKRLSAKDILKAEIVTVPGAQYSSSTKAVIRLYAVRKRGQGLSGSFYSEYAQGHYSPQTSEHAQLNYRTGGLDIFGEVGMAYNRSHTKYHSETQLNTTNNFDYNTRRTTNYNSGKILLNTGFNYEISEQQSFGMKYEANNLIGNNYSHSWGETDVLQDDILKENLSVESCSKSKPHWSHSVNAYYNGNFGKWNINFNADYYNNVEQSSQSVLNDGILDAESNTKVKNNLYATKLVVTAPLWKGKMSFGTEEMFTNRRNTFIQSGFSADAFNHIKQSIVAGFLEYNLNIGSMNYGAGLRYEHQTTKYYEKEILQTEQSPTYNDWIPFASIGYSHNGLNVGFSYRLNKYSPSYTMLKSSTDYISKYEYGCGDPHLKPQKQHSFMLNGNYKWVSFVAYYNYVRDMYMTWYKPYDVATHPDILLQTMATVPRSSYYGAAINAAPSFGIWQPDLTASVNFYHANLDHLNIPTMGNEPLFSFEMNNNFKLPHSWFINLSGNVSTNAKQSAGRNKCMGNVQFRVSKNFLKNDALKVMLVLRDLLHTGYYYFDANGTQSHRKLTQYSDNQEIGINVRYTFNATNSKYKGSGAGNSEKQRL